MKKSLLIFVTIIITSCNTTDADLPSKSDFKNFSEEPYIVGKITHISTKYIGEESFLEILVEENTKVQEPSDPGGNKISFFVSESTEILLQKRKGDLESISEYQLKKHQVVGGWTAGVVMLSYPAQAGAKRIVVIE